MRIRAALPAVVLVVFAVTAPSASAAANRPIGSSTPNSCIEVNGGDWTACNVGNSGWGDKAYRIRPSATPNSCIELNQGDANACNVGNSGRGDLPYRPVRH
jgi:hypothetical protein